MIIYSKYNTKIIDGYLEENIDRLVEEIITVRKAKKYPVTRTKASYIAEWKAHNRLYRLHIKRTHTKDVDLEENIDKCKDIIYRVIGV